MENPYEGTEFRGYVAAFDKYYLNKVNNVSYHLINSLNSYLLENSNHDAIKKLLRKELDTYENFKDFECLNELEYFKKVITLIIEQCDYTEINIESGTPVFKRILELRIETEFYFKTDCSNVYGNNLETIYNIHHLQDCRNFQNKINSCTDATTLKAHLTETFRKWKGKKSQWIEYTLLSIAPPNSNNNVLVTSAWFEWFESHKEQENEQISNDLEFEVKPIFKPEMIDTIFDLLKDFFSIEQQKDFKTFIETGNNVNEKLLFLDNGNRLADAFKQLKNADFITGCNQTDLINCIEKNFNYRYRNEVKSYRTKYLESIISTNKELCQKPIFLVKANSITKNIITRKF